MDAPQTFVVGYDGSPLSELALHRALRLTAHTSFSVIHVVCVVEDLGGNVRLPSGEVLSGWAALDSLRHTLHCVTKSWGRSSNIRVIAHIRGGKPSVAIVDLAYRYHADQLILGAYPAGSSGARLGSTTREVLQTCEIPVHVETPLMTGTASTKQCSPMRWAYVFGGPELRRHHLYSSSQSRNASA